MAMYINGGYFVLRQDIFNYLNEGEDLVMDACVRAAADRRMRAVPYHGFWAPMDTLKERASLEELHLRGVGPWEVWRDPRNETVRTDHLPLNAIAPSV
jgi:glucose-1-phosphate cytidylyltransferase